MSVASAPASSSLSARSAWTEDSFSSESVDHVHHCPMSPLSAALRTLHLNQARLDGAAGSDERRRAAVHEDLAAIVQSATRQPTDENSAGLLCKLSLKTSQTTFDGREQQQRHVALFEAKPLIGRSEVRKARTHSPLQKDASSYMLMMFA
jgi:hypothetical protein